MPVQDVALKTFRERWTIEKGGGRGSGRSVLMARHDDDDYMTDSDNIIVFLALSFMIQVTLKG